MQSAFFLICLALLTLVNALSSGLCAASNVTTVTVFTTLSQTISPLVPVTVTETVQVSFANASVSVFGSSVGVATLLTTLTETFSPGLVLTENQTGTSPVVPFVDTAPFTTTMVLTVTSTSNLVTVHETGTPVLETVTAAGNGTALLSPPVANSSTTLTATVTSTRSVTTATIVVTANETRPAVTLTTHGVMTTMLNHTASTSTASSTVYLMFTTTEIVHDNVTATGHHNVTYVASTLMPGTTSGVAPNLSTGSPIPITMTGGAPSSLRVPALFNLFSGLLSLVRRAQAVDPASSFVSTTWSLNSTCWTTESHTTTKTTATATNGNLDTVSSSNIFTNATTVMLTSTAMSTTTVTQDVTSETTTIPVTVNITTAASSTSIPIVPTRLSAGLGASAAGTGSAPGNRSALVSSTSDVVGTGFFPNITTAPIESSRPPVPASTTSTSSLSAPVGGSTTTYTSTAAASTATATSTSGGVAAVDVAHAGRLALSVVVCLLLLALGAWFVL